ncbi:hypothetical protein [Meiothermus cerbereus]|uniref:hypothetical protein n=1 Tax=Meiothermus cerbereus TaxID=65552 RepID=UPI003EEDB857
MEVYVFPEFLPTDQIEAWLARDLRAELNRSLVSDLTPRPVQLPLLEGGELRGFLEGRLVGLEERGPLRFLVVEGTFQGQPMRVAAEWEEVARSFDLEDTPLYLWRARRLPEEKWEAWRADLDQLGLADKAVLLGDPEGGPLCRAEPTQENAWAFWLAAWRFGSRVALDLGMRRASLERAFTALKERLPQLPDSLLKRSREAEGWGKEELRELRAK